MIEADALLSPLAASRAAPRQSTSATLADESSASFGAHLKAAQSRGREEALSETERETDPGRDERKAERLARKEERRAEREERREAADAKKAAREAAKDETPVPGSNDVTEPRDEIESMAMDGKTADPAEPIEAAPDDSAPIEPTTDETLPASLEKMVDETVATATPTPTLAPASVSAPVSVPVADIEGTAAEPASTQASEPNLEAIEAEIFEDFLEDETQITDLLADVLGPGLNSSAKAAPTVATAMATTQAATTLPPTGAPAPAATPNTAPLPGAMEAIATPPIVRAPQNVPSAAEAPATAGITDEALVVPAPARPVPARPIASAKSSVSGGAKPVAGAEGNANAKTMPTGNAANTGPAAQLFTAQGTPAAASTSAFTATFAAPGATPGTPLLPLDPGAASPSALAGTVQQAGGTIGAGAPRGPLFTAETSGPRLKLPTEQIGLEIVRQHAKGATRFEIRLDPPELGRIDVRLELAEDGGARTRLIAERPETLDLLQRDAKSLERALADLGFKTDRGSLDFSLHQDRRFQGEKSHAERDGGRHEDGARTSKEEPVTQAGLTRRDLFGRLRLNIII